MLWFWLIIFIVFLTGGIAALSSAPWLPTRGRDVKRMMDLGEVKAGDKVYDLGCGDGRLVFAAAKLGAKGVGIELFLLPYFYAKIKSFFVPGSRIIFGDFFLRNLAEADAVFVLLLSRSYGRLLKKFEKELKPGTRVVVSCWPITEWENKLVKKDKPSQGELPIFVYKV